MKATVSALAMAAALLTAGCTVTAETPVGSVAAVPPPSTTTPKGATQPLTPAGADAFVAAAEKELADLRAASATDQEKALAAARREAAAEERAKFETKLRRAEVRSALRAAGLGSDALLELAMKSDLFATLALDEEGRVADLEKAISALRRDAPELFAAAPAGTVTRGVVTPQPVRPIDLESAVAEHYKQK